ncbi:MAG TPA: SDR family NAD(P)-dependent oxidoreductase, partial [Arthrobacter sp.]|nr:SDR family NAD(P)-dependent oxidoreductase [Arthrobacter sp.]
MSLKDQVVLVTGSSGGIGDAVVDALTAEGAIVIGADRGAKEGQELAGFFTLDITSEEQCATVVRDVT